MNKRTIKKCVKCDHTWMAIVATPVKCPKCKSARWFRETKQRGRRSWFWKPITPGQKILYQWPETQEGRDKLSNRLYYYQRTNAALRITPLPQGIMVEWVKH